VTISTYEEYLALRADFIAMLTSPAPAEPPLMCAKCAPVQTLALVWFEGEGYCASHALMHSVGEKAAEAFA
jgi:hypothetical protein